MSRKLGFIEEKALIIPEGYTSLQIDRYLGPKMHRDCSTTTQQLHAWAHLKA